MVHTHPAATTTTTACGLPDATDYVYVLGVVALLLLPDAKSIRLGVFGFERYFRDLPGAARVAETAAKGDTLEGSVPYQDVLGQLLDWDKESG